MDVERREGGDLSRPLPSCSYLAEPFGADLVRFLSDTKAISPTRRLVLCIVLNLCTQNAQGSACLLNEDMTPLKPWIETYQYDVLRLYF